MSPGAARPGPPSIDNEKKQYFCGVVGAAKPEHFKAQREGRQVPYANHNADYQVYLNAIALGTQVGATMVLTMLAT